MYEDGCFCHLAPAKARLNNARLVIIISALSDLTSHVCRIIYPKKDIQYSVLLGVSRQGSKAVVMQG